MREKGVCLSETIRNQHILNRRVIWNSNKHGLL